jgi:hypothetical protein
LLLFERAHSIRQRQDNARPAIAELVEQNGALYLNHAVPPALASVTKKARI